MTNATAAMLVIGDEILSGRTRDINANVLAVALTAKGIDLAEAFGVHIDVREDAHDILKAYYAEREIELNAARLRMARIPDTALLIENPVSGAPGFSIGNVHVMAGVPKIFKAMLDGVLESLASGQPVESLSFRVDRPEGEIAGPLSEFAATYEDVSIGCYPFNEAGQLGCNVVMRMSDAQRLSELHSKLTARLMQI